MPKGELKINGIDAFDAWGVSLSDTALSALMTPAPKKKFISNKSRLIDGKKIIPANPKIDERQVSIAIHLTAPNEETFFERYASFCNDVLALGYMEIETRFQEGVIYRMEYESCSQFSQFMRGIAKFTLKLTEPNPNNRGVESV